MFAQSLKFSFYSFLCQLQLFFCQFCCFYCFFLHNFAREISSLCGQAFDCGVSFDTLRAKIAPKSVPRVHHDYFFSFNQWNHLFVVLLSLQMLFLKLPNGSFKQPRPQRGQERHKSVYLTIKDNSFACFSCSSFPRGEMTCFAVMW